MHLSTALFSLTEADTTRQLQNKEEVPDKNYSKQKMLLGTHTSEEEQNHLLLAEVHLPTEDSELESAQYDEESTELGGYGASPGVYLQP